MRAYPLVRFDPWELEPGSYDLGHGITLENCGRFPDEDWPLGHGLGAITFDRLRLLAGAEWAVTIDVPETHGATVAKTAGLDLADEFARDVLRTFLLSLYLVRPTNAATPLDVPFDRETRRFDLESLVDDWRVTEFHWADLPEHWPGEFRDRAWVAFDVELLRGVLDAVWCVRHMSDWREDLLGWTDSTLLSELVRNAERRWQKTEFAEYSQESLCDSRTAHKSPDDARRALTHVGGEVGDLFREHYEQFDERYGGQAAIFRRLFLERRNSLVCERSRLARALSLFEEAITLPYYPAFTLMCVLVETLFTTDKGNNKRQVVKRGAHVLAGGFDGQRDELSRLRALYKDRSALVHGAVPFSEIPDSRRRTAFYIARDCLLKIIGDNEHRHGFSEEDREKGDKYVRGLSADDERS